MREELLKVISGGSSHCRRGHNRRSRTIQLVRVDRNLTPSNRTAGTFVDLCSGCGHFYRAVLWSNSSAWCVPTVRCETGTIGSLETVFKVVVVVDQWSIFTLGLCVFPTGV